MAIEDFFRHRCTIYHKESAPKVAKYGLPSSEVTHTYPEEPSLMDIPCFFDLGNGTINGSILQNEPQSTYNGATEVSLPIGTVIRKGDKVVDMRFNLEYTAGFPEDIRGKYLSVPLFRKASQEAL